MRILLQRVTQAELHIAGNLHCNIGPGWVAFVGVGPRDDDSDQQWALDKILNLRTFGDGVERSITDVEGSLLVVSQFTLYADCRKGRRPGFSGAAAPDVARAKFAVFIERLKSATRLNVQTGVFGAAMQVSLTNDGPFTIYLDSEKDRSHAP